MTPRIVVVEDEAIAAWAMSQMLENSGFAVLGVASSGEEAVALSQGLLPDLVLMDVKLKGSMSGIESARIIQAHRKIPVIFTTAYSVDEIDAFHDTANSVLFLAKPVQVNDLVRAVYAALGTDEQ